MPKKEILNSKRRQEILPWFAIALLIVLLFSVFYNFGIIGGDDINVVEYNIQEENLCKQISTSWQLFLSGQERSIISTVFSLICNKIQCSFGLLWFRLCNVTAILFSLYIAAKFVRYLLGRKAALFYTILFLLFVQVYDGTVDYGSFSAFLSMGISYQLKIVFVLSCLYEFMLYFDDMRAKHLFWSALFYFMSCALYEAFTLLCIPVFVIALLCLKRGNDLSLKALWRSLFPSITAGILYLIYYFLPHYFFGKFNYNGIVVSQTASLRDRLVAWLEFTLQSAPLRLSFISKEYSVTDALISTFHDSPLLFGLEIVCFLFVAVCVNFLLRQLPVIPKRKIGRIILCCALCAFSATFLIAQTVNYSTIATSHDPQTQQMAISYFPYFFIIAILVCSALLITHLKGKAFQTAALLLSLLVFVGGLITWTSNSYYKNKFNKRYYSLEEMFSTSAFAQVQDGDTLLAYKYVDFHKKYDRVEDCIFELTGKHISIEEFSYDTDTVQISGTWYLKYNYPAGNLVFTYIGEDFASNEVWVFFPNYQGDEVMYLDCGENFGQLRKFPLDGRPSNLMESIDFETTENGYTLVHMVTKTPYDFRHTHADF
ncbi:MAG: hypothetical protein VB092_09010 [Oscillospiraceae bacterium]|nr:hypothetical protein [Oscillospiraceae bacterium]